MIASISLDTTVLWSVGCWQYGGEARTDEIPDMLW